MYHKIIDKEGNIIGISGPDSEDINDESWVEITLEEYGLLSKQMEENESNVDGETNEESME